MFAFLVGLVLAAAGGLAVVLEMPLEELVIESDHVLIASLVFCSTKLLKQVFSRAARGAGYAVDQTLLRSGR